MDPVFRRLRAAVLITAVALTATPTPAAEWLQPVPQGTRSEPEFTQAVADLNRGQLFMTSGLVCDRASEVDAVITLARKGEKLNEALEQINAGAEIPRCVVGRQLIAEYQQKFRSFTVENEIFHVHKVQVVGIAMRTPHGIVPVKLKKPLEQYVVSADNSEPA